MDPVNASILIVYGIATVGMIVMAVTFEPMLNVVRCVLTKLANRLEK